MQCYDFTTNIWYTCIDHIVGHIHTYYPPDTIGPGLSVEYDHLYEPWDAPTYVDHINAGMPTYFWIIVSVGVVIILFTALVVLGLHADKSDEIKELDTRVKKLERKIKKEKAQ